MAAIFISHSSRDNETAAEIKSWLAGQGYENVFLDFDKETGLNAGEEWERQLYEAIERCHAVILCITPSWMASHWCITELRFARILGKSIFPIVRTPDDRKIVGPELRAIQTELWDAGGKVHLERRLGEIAHEIARSYRWDRSRPPWPGIFSFDAEDAAVFFGRDAETRKVAELLEARRNHGGARFLLMVGGSGSGKSSLMKAGVLPYVARGGKRFVSLAPFRPGATPLTTFTKVLADAVGADWHTVVEALSGDNARARLAAYLEELRIGPAREATVLIAIDQFEEVFTVADATERNAFLRLLTLATDRERPLPVLALATVRSDLLGEILNADAFHITHETWTLGPLPSDRLADVIEGPAHVGAVHLDAGLTSRILKDLGSTSDALPLLAFALRELYERYGGDKSLTLLEYEELGDRERNLRPLENAVRRKAEETLAAAQPSAAELTALKEAFVGALVRVNEEGVRLRRPARIEDMPAASHRLIERLASPEARLLSIRTEGDLDLIEVAHEALFRAWPQLSAWLDEEQDFLIGRRQIEEAERSWSAAPAPKKDAALLSGLLLEKAREWSVTFPERLRNMRDYVLASIRRDDAQRSAARRRQRFLAAASVAVALVFAAVGGLALVQSKRADQQTARAEEQAAIAQSEAARAEEAATEAERQAARADQEAQRAQMEAGRAQEQRDEALRQQSLFLADLSRQQSAHGDYGTALALALEALPAGNRNTERPYVPQAEAALYEAASNLHESAVLRGHENAVTSAAFSPDGTRVMTGSSDGTARLWNAASGAEIAVLRGHESGVETASFSPDGTNVVTGSWDGTARLWDAASGTEIAVLRGHQGDVSSASFSPDGTRIVTASDDTTARLWNEATGAQIAVLRGHQGDVSSASFSPDGTRVVTGSLDGTARLWDATSGTNIAVLEGHEDVVHSAAFSPDGMRVVTVSADNTAELWDAATGAEVALLIGHVGGVTSAAFSSDGTRVVTSANDNTARLWDAASGAEIAVLRGHERAVETASFSPDGTGVVTGSEDGTARLWDAASGAEIAVLRGHEDFVTSAAFSPDGTRIVTASYDTTARLWNEATGTQIAVLRGHEDLVTSAAFSPDGTRVVTGSWDGTARLWDAASGTETAVLEGENTLEFAAFSPDGTRVVTASGDRTARLWDAASGAEIAVFRGHEDFVRSAAFSPDGTRVVTASGDTTARLWDAASGAEIAVFRGHEDFVRSAAFSPDGTRVVTASGDTTARLWDVAGGAEIAVLKGHKLTVESAAFSPDGARVVTASGDSTARLWDATSGAEIAVLRGHEDIVQSASFAPGGKQVVTAAWDGTARLWDADSGAEIAVLRGHQGYVLSAAFSPDGTRIVTASVDRTARLWDAAGGAEVGLLRGIDDSVPSAAFSPDGTSVVTVSDDNTARLWRVFPKTQNLIDYAYSIMPRELTPEQRRQFFIE